MMTIHLIVMRIDGLLRINLVSIYFFLLLFLLSLFITHQFFSLGAIWVNELVILGYFDVIVVTSSLMMRISGGNIS